MASARLKVRIKKERNENGLNLKAKRSLQMINHISSELIKAFDYDIKKTGNASSDK